MDNRYFQWIAGERKGEVVVFNDIVVEDGMTFVTFKDNSRVNSDLIAEINETSLTNKMVAEVESPSNIWRFEEVKIPGETDGPRVEQDWESQVKYEIPSVEEIIADGGTPVKRKKKIKLIPPRPTKNKFGKIATTDDLAATYNESINTQQQVAQTTPVEPAVNVSDPVYIMMDKSKKVDTEVNMTLTISLPSSHLFDVVRDSFDDGANKALEYIIENIDISDIKLALREGIKEMYGPNDDPEDNKIPVVDLSQFKSPGVPVIEIDNNAHTGGLYEPECIEEPIIADAKIGEGFKELEKEIAEKAEKINESDG